MHINYAGKNAVNCKIACPLRNPHRSLLSAGVPDTSRPANSAAIMLTGVTLEAVDINDLLLPTNVEGPLAISGAQNEWISFAVRIGHLPRGAAAPNLRLSLSPAIAAENFSAYQALPMPVDTNSAGYVRQTGLSSGTRQLPRALLPLTCENGIVDLSSLRDPAHPFDPQAGRAAERRRLCGSICIFRRKRRREITHCNAISSPPSDRSTGGEHAGDGSCF